MRARRSPQATITATLAAALAVAAAGCHGDVFELPAGLDAGAAATDGGGDDGPTGPVFFAEVQADFDSARLGCTGVGCHRDLETKFMHLTPNPIGETALRGNWDAVRPRATMGGQSLLLLKSLQGSGTDHQGGKPFLDARDATYRRWLAWIEAGAPFAAPDGGSP